MFNYFKHWIYKKRILSNEKYINCDTTQNHKNYKINFRKKLYPKLIHFKKIGKIVKKLNIVNRDKCIIVYMKLK